MSLIEALIFGLLQGLTEFLPISSSAHVKLAKLFFHVESSDSQVIFDLVCHLGTLFALLIYLRQEIKQVLIFDRQKLLLLFIATLPLIPCYILLKPLRDFASDPSYLGICLMGTALILFLGQKWKLRKERGSCKTSRLQKIDDFCVNCQSQLAGSCPSDETILERIGEKEGRQRTPKGRFCGGGEFCNCLETKPALKHSVRDVLWIGAMQSAALIPGISRSASTISCAKILGWETREAVHFSFLLSIPTIIGGNCLELLKIYLSKQKPDSISLPACFVGFAASFIFGFLIIRFALSFLEKGNFKPFAWYCLCFGIVVTAMMNF